MTTTQRPKRPQPSREQIAILTGDKVVQTDDYGKQHQRVARSEPWKASSGDWLILLEGVSGCYLLTRCQPVP